MPNIYHSTYYRFLCTQYSYFRELRGLLLQKRCKCIKDEKFSTLLNRTHLSIFRGIQSLPNFTIQNYTRVCQGSVYTHITIYSLFTLLVCIFTPIISHSYIQPDSQLAAKHCQAPPNHNVYTRITPHLYDFKGVFRPNCV